jgi:hypothetical protein
MHPRPPLTVPALAIGAAVLWGAIEFVALCRSRWTQRGTR